MREADIRPPALFSRYLGLLARDIERLFGDRSGFVDVPCVGCGAEAPAVAFEKLGFRYVTCGECASLYLSPRPSGAALRAYYAESEAVRFWSSDFYRETAEARRENILRPRARLVRDVVARDGVTPGTFVDVGAGYGILLEEIARLGLFVQIVGVEPAVELAAVCRERGFRVIEKPVEAVGAGEVSANFVTAFEVLEHVADPAAFLVAVRGLLAPGGTLLLTTLTVSGFDIQVLWEHSNAVSPPQHINLLSVEGMRRLVERAGLALQELTTPGTLDVDIVANALAADPELPLPQFVRTLLGRGPAAQDEFQALLQRHHLSSHVQVVARLGAGGGM